MVSDCAPGCEESRTTYFLEVGGSVMVSDCAPGCEESRTTYFLKVERERDGVRLWTRMRREQDDVLPGGGEGA